MRNETTLEEIRQILLSLLVARPGSTPVALLDNDYYEAEGRRIPWRDFGFASVVEFLQSMPQYFYVERRGNVNYVHGIASDKSKHVSSLVSRQRKTVIKHGSSNRYRLPYVSYIPHQRPKIPAEQLNDLMQYVRNFPEGVNIRKAIMILKNQLPHITLTENDVRHQLRELGHNLYLDGDIIRPVLKNSFLLQVNTLSHSQSPLPASKLSSSKVPEPSTSKLPNYKTFKPSTLRLPSYNTSESSTSKVVYTVPEECPNLETDDDYDEEGDFVQSSSQHRLRWPKADERIALSLKDHYSYEPTFSYHDYKRTENEKYGNDDTQYPMNSDMIEHENNNLVNLVSDKVRSRLKQLMQKYPNGIRCWELSELYMKEYKMPLNYADLGFNSVHAYACYLSDIFYVSQKSTNDDFILYSVDKKPNKDVAESNNQETSRSYVQKTSRTKPINIPNSRCELHNMNENNTPVPSDLSPSMFDKFVPENVITNYEDIKHILVTDLQKGTKRYLEVYVVEIFTPSFFWVHLRQNKRHFEMFMDDLHSFYNKNHQSYSIPRFALKRGLNCACVYSGKWHRAVIKTVKPDFKVTVLFYDYGTQKTYIPEDLYYLHSNFSYLAAQAIPCGLFNVKPYVGDRWKKSITDRFIDRISDSLLAADIVSIDPPNNSMLIILTDTSEEEDVHINDWLVQENLARCGKMVRINRNIPFERYYMRHLASASEPVETVADTDQAKRDINRLTLSGNKHTHRLPNVISESSVNNIKALPEVPDRKIVLHYNINEHVSGRNSLDSMSRPKGNSTREHKPKRFVNLLQLVKEMRARHNMSSSNDSTPKMPKDDVSRMDSDAKVQMEPRHNEEHFDYERIKRELNTNFDQWDSDNETENTKRNFGTSRNIYDRHSEMTPFDWSVVRQMSTPSFSSLRENLNSANTTVNANTNINEARKAPALSSMIRHCHETNDKIKESSKSFIMEVARMDSTEYFLADNNIDHDGEDMSQSVARLRRRLETQNDNCTKIIVPRKMLEKLRLYACSKKSASCDTMASSLIENLNSENSYIIKSDETRETRIDHEIENRDSHFESVKPPQDLHLFPKDSLESRKYHQRTPNSLFNSGYELLLNHLSRTKQRNSCFESMKGWSNSGPERSSCYSRSSTEETMNLSDDEQREALSRKNVMSRFNKLQNFTTKSASRKLIEQSSSNKSNSEVEGVVSDNDESLSDVIYPQLNRMNLLNDLRASEELLRHVLKMQWELNQEQLDSDDDNSSDHETNDSVVTPDLTTIHGAFSVSDLADNDAIMPVTSNPPIINDLDIDSDIDSDIDFDSSIWKTT